MNSLCTKQPLNKGHPYITAKMLFPKGGRYGGVPLYAISYENAWADLKRCPYRLNHMTVYIDRNVIETDLEG